MAMDVFSLTGKIAVDYSEASSSLDKVKESAKKTADSLDDVDDAAEDAGDSVEDAGDSADKADGQFSTWKVTLANLASQAITALISKCTELAEDIVDLGIDTETAFAKLETIAGTENIDALSESISQLSKETGVSSAELANVAYNAISAGASAEDAMDMVTAATKLGVAGFTDADSALSVLSTAMNSYGDSCGTVEEISDSLIMVQNLGVTTIDELSSSMGKAIATGSAYSVNLGNLESAYVSITKAGISTEEATTYLNSMLNELGDSGSDVSAILQEQTGKSFTELMEDGYSLSDVLGILYDSCGDDSTALMNLWSSAEAGKASNAIVNQGLEEFNENLEAITGSSGATESAYSTMADTMGTKIEVMKTNFQELGLKIFDGLEEPLNSAITFVTDTVIPALETLIDNFDKIAPVVAAVTAAFIAYKVAMGISSIINTLTKATEGTTIAQMALNAVLNANPIVLIVTLIAGLVAALVVLWNTNDGFREAVMNAWETIKNAFGTAIEAIKNFFTGLADKISSILDTIWNTISNVFETITSTISAAITTVVDTVSTGLQTVSDWFSNIWNTITGALSTAWETIKNVVQVGLMFIEELISAAFQLITLPFQLIWQNCGDTILAAWETIKTTVSNALDAIQNVISTVWNAIVSFLTPILEGIQTTFSTVWNAISSTVSTVINAIKNTITTVMNAIKTTITTVWNAISSAISTVMNAIKSTISSIWNSIKSTVSTVINAIKSTISTVFNAIKSTISTVLNSIKSTFSNIWNGIKSTVSTAVNGVKSTISSGLNGAFSTVTNVLTNIKNKFTSIFDGVKTTVSNAISTIKGYFNFSWSLPSIKLPHFKISGSFSLNPPSVPSFGVEWYKKAMEDGMIMNSPTIFGFNSDTNQLMAGGEAGSETVVGTENLMEMITAAVNAENVALSDKLETLIAYLAEYLPQILEAMGFDIVLDNGVLVGELAPGMDEELGRIAKRKNR